MHPALATMIGDISVDSDHQMSNWAINRYSSQINIIGGPEKKTKCLFSQQTIFFASCLSVGDVKQPLILLENHACQGRIPTKSGHCDPKTNSFKAHQHGDSNPGDHPEIHLPRAAPPGCAVPSGRYSKPVGVYRTTGVTSQITGCLHS